VSNVEEEVEFRRQGAMCQIQFLGHTPPQIKTKFVVLVKHGVPQRVEWFKNASFKYTSWRTAAIFNKLYPSWLILPPYLLYLLVFLLYFDITSVRRTLPPFLPKFVLILYTFQSLPIIHNGFLCIFVIDLCGKNCLLHNFNQVGPQCTC